MLLKSLLDKKKKIAVLAGAGVSLDSPANLLDGWNFMFETLRRVCPPEIDDMLRHSSVELKNENAWKRSWVLSILDLPNTPFHRPGEQLRFEVLMAELVQSGLDPELRVLKCLDACDRPNRNHYILAQLIRSGHIVITTNFDRLIEIAYARLGQDGAPLRIAYMDEDFPETGPSLNSPPTLWKVHGSFSVAGQDTRHSIQATMMSVLATTMTTRKKAFFEKMLAAFDLWVVGYSGWDDLDMIPTLANAPSKERLIWIDHKNVPEPVVKDASMLNTESRAQWEIDSVARDRIRFTDSSTGQIIRDPDKVLIISTSTSRMMDAVCETYFEGQIFDVEKDDFKFGRKFPHEVQKYFDAWRTGLSHGRSAPYQFVAEIFSNRANARTDVQTHLQDIYRKIHDLQAAPTATPDERLRSLIGRFNHLEEPKSRAAVEELRQNLLALLPSLPAELEGTATRLSACLSWVLDGPTVGTEMFKQAVAIDRQAGRAKQEFSTLTTWRSVTGFNQWDDLLSGNMSEEIRERVGNDSLERLRYEAAYVTSLSGNLLFPEEEIRRIHELAGKIGFFPILWDQAVRSVFDVIDDDPQVLLILHDRISRVKRFSVDLGDVLGEAYTTLISGRMYIIDRQYMMAIEELLRVIELNRIVNRPNLAFEATENLKYCTAQIGQEHVNRIRPHLQQSMWGKVLT